MYRARPAFDEDVVIGMQTALFVLDHLANSFDEHVVTPRVLAVHADGDAISRVKPLPFQHIALAFEIR
jgi:hypothetical protein